MPRFPYEIKCNCPVCKSNRQDIAHSRKYGSEHHEACLCDWCVRMYVEHNRTKTCACDDCVSHRAYLYNKDNQRDIKRRITVANVTGKPGRQKNMATLNMCERCGAMALSKAMGGIQSWDQPNGSMGEAQELCPGCVGEFHSFMKGEPVSVGDRPKTGYRHPWEAPKSDLGTVSTEDLAKALLSRQLEAGKTDGQ